MGWDRTDGRLVASAAAAVYAARAWPGLACPARRPFDERGVNRVVVVNYIYLAVCAVHLDIVDERWDESMCLKVGKHWSLSRSTYTRGLGWVGMSAGQYPRVVYITEQTGGGTPEGRQSQYSSPTARTLL